MIKKSSLLVLISALGLLASVARAEGWLGYMNVFDNNAGSQGGYLWGNPWGVNDLKTTVAVSNTGTYIGDKLILEPNFNTYDATNAYWANGALGNKFMEANTFVETTSIATSSVNFTGVIESYTLASGYSASAFIKVLNPGNGYSLDVFQTWNLSSGASFNLSADLSTHQGKILQLGFMVSGLNANPTNVGLGDVTVTVTAPIPEPSSYAALCGVFVGCVALVRRRRR